MRMVFGLAGLVIVLAIVGALAKKQLAALDAPVPTAAQPDAGQATAAPVQRVRQFEQAVQGAMQQARPLPDDH